MKTARETTTKKTLIVCDVQPEVVQKLPQPRQFVDFVHTCIAAARQCVPQPIQIVHTLLHFASAKEGYTEIPLSHPRLGILRKLGAKNPNLNWFASLDLSVIPLEHEMKLTRATLLPQANDTILLVSLRHLIGAVETAEVTVIGYGPVVQAICSLLGDVLAAPNVQILRECVSDEIPTRCKAFLDHGLLFNEQVVSLVDFLESLDLLHEKINTPHSQLSDVSPTTSSALKYVTDCGRGGHLSLFMPYLLQDHGYCLWPKQPWYKELSLTSKKNTEYFCPLGRRVVELCDEPQFGYGTKFFLAGRQHLDEKNLLYDLVPELLPPTFAAVEEAREYAKLQPDPGSLVWFLKKVNQNGGRAITISSEPPSRPLERDDQLQVHIPRPLLYHENHERKGQFKCHIKTYQYLACNQLKADPTKVEWVLYMHDCFYLATANAPWSPNDLSDDAQITTMRTHRLYEDNPWRIQWNITNRIRTNIAMVIERAVAQGKLQSQHSTVATKEGGGLLQPSSNISVSAAAALQFEVNSADWMLDEDGRLYLIEINGIPVLYDAGMPQDLCTKGLRLYDRFYKENPKTAVVNDHDLLREAIGLALTGQLPDTTLWKHVTTIASSA